MTAWDSFGVMTTRNALGAAACRPYDRARDGTVLGRGRRLRPAGGAEAARARGATIYAEVARAGAAFDTGAPDHPRTRPAAAVTAAAERALASARPGATDVDYIASHGDGTKDGDASEAARASRGSSATAACRRAASSRRRGNLVGGAGALNAAVAALAVAHDAVPPTLNLESVDPDCAGIDWSRRRRARRAVDAALALARGLEGQNVALALAPS